MLYTIVKRIVVKKIHHWCSMGTGKSQLQGPPFQWETKLCQVSHWNGEPQQLGFSGSTEHQ